MSASRRLFRFAFATTLTGLALTCAGSALAQGPAVATAPPATEAPPAPAQGVQKQWGIAANPLSTIVGRYGIDVTYMIAQHQGIVLNPFYQHVSADVTSSSGGVTTTSSSTFSGFGGELGYRYFTGDKAMNGFYIGPSFIFGSYAQKNSEGEKTAFTSIGGAIDLGGQYVSDSGFMIGGGFGLQYTKTSTQFDDLPFGAKVLAGGGVRPRFLFTIGYSF